MPHALQHVGPTFNGIMVDMEPEDRAVSHLLGILQGVFGNVVVGRAAVSRLRLCKLDEHRRVLFLCRLEHRLYHERMTRVRRQHDGIDFSGRRRDITPADKPHLRIAETCLHVQRTLLQQLLICFALYIHWNLPLRNFYNKVLID